MAHLVITRLPNLTQHLQIIPFQKKSTKQEENKIGESGTQISQQPQKGYGAPPAYSTPVDYKSPQDYSIPSYGMGESGGDSGAGNSGGNGGNGGGDDGGSGDFMRPLSLMYAVAIAGGGVAAYARKGSKYSLTASIIFAAIILACWYSMPTSKLAFRIALGTTRTSTLRIRIRNIQSAPNHRSTESTEITTSSTQNLQQVLKVRRSAILIDLMAQVVSGTTSASVVLCGLMANRYVKSEPRKFMPSGMVATMSGLMSVAYLLNGAI
eukprot:TRINITY_DN2929_c0_g1_i5.p1 TRINITY_DN2929_c0_g1~~TRINITY_DN2929_c0_g1_i5.p1  ORF type:complete len:266 (-),score=26.30 TRINITY_DN2929_c0_g1_i5:249-1046(-)